MLSHNNVFVNVDCSAVVTAVGLYYYVKWVNSQCHYYWLHGLLIKFCCNAVTSSLLLFIWCDIKTGFVCFSLILWKYMSQNVRSLFSWKEVLVLVMWEVASNSQLLILRLSPFLLRTRATAFVGGPWLDNSNPGWLTYWTLMFCGSLLSKC